MIQLKQLGPYEIGEPLGKGGMGSVYAATDTRTGQRVAVKALSPHLAVAEGFRERFEAEIESLKTLRHDGIVRLYGYGEQDGVLFYSMELVDGVSLEDELKAGRRFNWREVTNIAIQVALALKHAHDHGVVHRDIKPANILLQADDRVKLADFGIARLFGATQLTTAGGVLGTADYMSPEQADGRPVTARCDQYSLGGVMYSLLAGRPPFRAKNLPQMLQLQRFAEPEPVRRFAPDTPEQLERVVMQLLSKDPAQRFPNTQVLARHLQAMVNALSRPVAEELAVVEPQPEDRSASQLDESLLTAQTREDSSGQLVLPRSAASGGAAQRELDPGSRQSAATLAALNGALPADASPARPAHFTTVEEEERARQQAARRHSRLALVTQLAALALLVGGLTLVVIRVSRPATADELYAQITSNQDRSGADAQAEMDRKIGEFVSRFPDEPRIAELHQHRRRIALDQAERRLEAAARRGSGDVASLLPVEQLYVNANEAAQGSLPKGIAMLDALLALYSDVNDAPAAGGEDFDTRQRQRLTIALAERRLTALQADWARWTKQQLTLLHERLGAAERLSAKDPQRAAAMYQAIIDLHQNDPWAAGAVDQARKRLSALAN